MPDQPFSPESLKSAVAAVVTADPAVHPHHQFATVVDQQGVYVGMAMRADNGWTVDLSGGIDFQQGPTGKLTISRAW